MHDCKILECILDVLVFKDDVSVDTIKMPLDIKTTMEFIIFTLHSVAIERKSSQFLYWCWVNHNR